MAPNFNGLSDPAAAAVATPDTNAPEPGGAEAPQVAPAAPAAAATPTSAPAAAPGQPGLTPEQQQADTDIAAQNQKAANEQAAAEKTLATPEAPPMAHQRLFKIVQAIGAGLSGVGQSIATGGKEGGAEETEKILSAEQQQRNETQRLAMEKKNTEFNQHIALLDTAQKQGQNIGLLSQLHANQVRENFQMSEDIRKQEASTVEFQKNNFGMNEGQASGKDPLTPAERQSVTARATQEMNPMISLIPDSPSAIAAQKTLADPNSSPQDLIASRDAVQNAVTAKQAQTTFEKAQLDLSTAKLQFANEPKNIDLQNKAHQASINADNAKANMDNAMAKLYAGGTGGIMTPELKADIAKLPPSQQAILGQYDANTQSSLMSVAFGNGSADPTKLFPARLTKGAPGLPLQQAWGVIHQLNPRLTEEAYDVTRKMYLDATTGKLSDQAGSLNNFIGHADKAWQVSSKLSGLGPRVLNMPLNQLEKAGYGTEYTNLQEALSVVNGEFNNLVKSGYAPTADEVKAQQTVLNANATVGQIHGALQVMGHMAQTRATTMNETYKRGASGQNFPNLIFSEHINAARELGMDPSEFDTGGTVGMTPANTPANAPQQNGAVPAGTTGKAKGTDGNFYYHDAKGTILGPVPAGQ